VNVTKRGTTLLTFCKIAALCIREKRQRCNWCIFVFKIQNAGLHRVARHHFVIVYISILSTTIFLQLLSTFYCGGSYLWWLSNTSTQVIKFIINFQPVQLDWWPIARDCFIYVFNTIILLVLAWSGSISFTESCIMMGFLILYYLITFNNNKFMPAIRVFIEDRMNCCFSTRYGMGMFIVSC